MKCLPSAKERAVDSFNRLHNMYPHTHMLNMTHPICVRAVYKRHSRAQQPEKPTAASS